MTTPDAILDLAAKELDAFLIEEADKVLAVLREEATRKSTHRIRGGLLNVGDVIHDGSRRIEVKTIRPTKEYLFVNTTKRYDRAAWVTVER